MADTDDRILLARIDERINSLNNEFSSMRLFLTERVVTKEQCLLRQSEHDRTRNFERAEAIAKICVMLSIAVGIFWAVITKV